MTKNNLNTANDIKRCAQKLFLERGFDGVLTRDIADACGVNVSLINYHFKSKQGLYEIIVMDTLQEFFGGVLSLFNTPGLSPLEKLDKATDTYVDFLLGHPDVPLFIIGEIRKNPKQFVARMPLSLLMGSALYRELSQEIGSERMTNVIMSWLGMMIMPIIVEPAAREILNVDHREFARIVHARKSAIMASVVAIIGMKEE